MSSLSHAAKSNCAIATRRTLLATSLLLGLATMGTVNAEIYRYTEGGRVVYGDSIPVARADARHTVFNSKGVAVKEVKSLVERRAEQRKAQEAEAIRLRDNGLLQTYSSEEEMIISRDEKIAHIDDQMNQLAARTITVEESLSGIERNIRAEERVSGANMASANLYAEQKRAINKIEATRSLIEMGAAERDELIMKFESDIARYQWLKSGARNQ